MVEVRFQVGQVALIVACLEGLVLTVYIYGVEKQIWGTSGFVLQAMIEESPDGSGPCTLQLSCGT